MTQNKRSEFGTGRGVERMPDDKTRPVIDPERVRIERTVGLRDQTVADAELEVRQRR